MLQVTRYIVHNILMFFQNKHRKKINAIWAVLCVLIIISMILLYTPILFY
ncbi:MAG: hypothetical protein UX94_C0005G0064 [Parcubacteria group bacterium GW2011_GWA2_47_21]|nr:MAG: hypothetical protein UX94_C0005G0064 [Parcubacteria group bacterium GW2011_GWA2_47_21]